jgi:hypothetical protein
VVARRQAHLHGLATAIRETSGLIIWLRTNKQAGGWVIPAAAKDCRDWPHVQLARISHESTARTADSELFVNGRTIAYYPESSLAV